MILIHCALSILTLLWIGLEAGAYEERDFLMRKFGETGNVFPMGWKPYPDYDDREGWAVMIGDRTDEFVQLGEQYLDYQWQTIPLTSYLAFERTGDRNGMQKPYDANRRAINGLIMAELAEGKGRFLDQIANGVWMSCYMPSWALSAHLTSQSSHRSQPDVRENMIDISSAGYGATLALAYRFFKEEFAGMDPVINYAIETAVREKVLDPYLDKSLRKAHWWMVDERKGDFTVNNWNPWCNSNVLLCFLLMETDKGRFDEAVETALYSVDSYLNYIKGDGACEEGPAYWGLAACKVLDFLAILDEASDGKFSLWDEPMVRAMGEYIVRSYVGDGYVVNFADASAKTNPDAALVYRFGKAVDSRILQDFAYRLCKSDSKFAVPHHSPWTSDTFRSIESLTAVKEMKPVIDSLNNAVTSTSLKTVLENLESDLPEWSWYPETEFAYMRNAAGWFLGAKGGFNNESHNHNDVGSFLLYINKIPVFVDAGVGTYTKQTFSAERYGIWTMQSDWHNLPAINGTSQIAGNEFKANDVVCDMRRGSLSMDISSAYSEAAACRRWRRSYMLGADRLEITDSFDLTRRIAADTLNFLVQGNVYLPGEKVDAELKCLQACPGGIVRQGYVVIVNGTAAVSMSFPASLRPSVLVRELDDPNLTKVWGCTLRRISFVSSPSAPRRSRYSFVVRSAD